MGAHSSTTVNRTLAAAAETAPTGSTVPRKYCCPHCLASVPEVEAQYCYACGNPLAHLLAVDPETNALRIHRQQPPPPSAGVQQRPAAQVAMVPMQRRQ